MDRAREESCGDVPDAGKTIGHDMFAKILTRAAFLVAAFGAAAGSARADTPLSYMRTFGPAADPVTRLNYGLLTISVVVVLLIGLLVLWGSLRKRPPMPDADGRLPVGPAHGGMAWIYIGVGISTVVLLGSAAWTLLTLSAVAAPQNASGVNVDVIAHQWWWEVHYIDWPDRFGERQPSNGVATANEIHIPVDTANPITVEFELDSHDVIHSFWVPNLQGKQDIVPGHPTSLWLQADSPGEYWGECGEYCGYQHAQMRLLVVAEPAEKFHAWLDGQRQEAHAPETEMQSRGRDVFLHVSCAMCHAISGTQARASLGPDLSHVASRKLLASGAIPNRPGHLAGWVTDPQKIKPGVHMPQNNLEPHDLRALLEYLESLK